MADLSHGAAEQIIMKAAMCLPTPQRKAIVGILEEGTDHDLIPENEAAKILSMSKSQLWRWRQGQLDEPFPFSIYPVPNAPNQVRYLRSEIRHYISQRLQPPDTDEQEQTDQSKQSGSLSDVPASQLQHM